MAFESVPSGAAGPAPIAYLGPELPALSATFVYEELLGLERRGIPVLPFSVRRPEHPAPGQESLRRRTRVLYDRPAPALALGGLWLLFSFGGRTFRALGWLLHDMISVGLHRPASWKLAFQCLAGARLARELSQGGCVHLHVHFAHTPAQIAMYASAFSGIPFTVTAHANDIFERGLLLPEKARRARKLLTISHFNVAYLRTVGVADEKLAVVRCGVAFTPRPDVPVAAAKARYRIGTLCRLVEKKGVGDLLRALALLSDAAWQVELIVAGDGPLRGDLERLAAQLGLAEGAVTFIGALDHADVAQWMHSLDAFVIAAKRDANGDMDGIPVALMEAMSQYVPVVSTRLSGIPELVMHERTGLLAAPSDPADLARELRRLLNDPALRGRLAEAGARHVESEFGQQSNLNRLLEHFTPLPMNGDCRIEQAPSP